MGSNNSRYGHEAKESGCTLGEVQVRASEQPGFNVTGLRPALDEASCFEIIKTAVEGPHGLHRPARQKLPASEDRCVRSVRIHGAGEGGKDGASAVRKLLNVSGAESGAKDN